MNEEKHLELASKVEREYKEGLAYKQQMGFLHKWPEYERMKSGDQWPAITERTKTLPRPVFNIIRQIQNHKISSVMNENIKMIYTAQDVVFDETLEGEPPEVEAADIFTKYADTMWEELKQDDLNEEMLDSGANIGTGILHYYMDKTISGGNTLKWLGAMRGETIDAVNFFPGNPQQRNVQKQPYIIITHRELVSSVREEALSNGTSEEMVRLIQADSDTQDQAYDMAKKELDGSDKVTVITRYWKQIPESTPTIYFMKVASGVVVKHPTDTGMKRYPIAVMQWDRRKQSIFGIGDTEGLIPNQRAINLLMAMQLRSAQLTGMPKLAVDRNVIQQQITNEIGEIINVSGVQGSIDSAIRYLTPASMPSHIPMLVDSFMNYTKEISGANENALGEQNSSQLNATAIMLLQKASGVPIESIKRRFYRAMEDVGLIWAEFWKQYYNTDRMVSVKDDNNEEEVVMFNGSTYKDVDLRLKIDIGPSSSFSESLMMTSLDKLFDMGHIQLRDYLQFAPKNVIPFKDRLLKVIEEREQQAMMQQQMLQEQFIANLPPEAQQTFMNASPQAQQSILEQHMGQQEQQNALPPTPQVM